MTIGSILPIASLTPADSTIAFKQAAVGKAKAEPPPKAPFDPLPALRPTIQDTISIDRALLALRAQ